VNLERPQRAAVVAEDWARAPARLDDVQGAEKRGGWRGVRGDREREEENRGFHFAPM
jgi:hypothetical protein